jgi:hypothetical protein
LKNAVVEYRRDVDYCWNWTLPDQPVRSHGVEHQIDFEYFVVVVVCVWVLQVTGLWGPVNHFRLSQ